MEIELLNLWKFTVCKCAYATGEAVHWTQYAYAHWNCVCIHCLTVNCFWERSKWKKCKISMRRKWRRNQFILKRETHEYWYFCYFKIEHTEWSMEFTIFLLSMKSILENCKIINFQYISHSFLLFAIDFFLILSRIYSTAICSKQK